MWQPAIHRQPHDPSLLHDIWETVRDPDVWLGTPNDQLGGRAPEDLLGDLAGEKLVRDLIRAIQHGMCT
jgi:uncharacterized protein (DUF2384 family)